MGRSPPIYPEENVDFTHYSPFSVSLLDVALRFAKSPQRRDIFIGFLDYRKELHQAGIVSGFQWIDGSFVEDIETLEDRMPRDIDVVTFYHLSPDRNFKEIVEKHAELFNHKIVKQNYLTDAYYVSLQSHNRERLVKQAVYWYSMWSHQRNYYWKGFLRIDLSPIQDEMVRKNFVAKREK